MKTILIAEDEKFIRKGLKTMVQRAPISVDAILEARDGEEALEVLRRGEVDLLITDIRMPKMDGIELVSHLGELDYRPMVLVVSGYDDFSYAVEMLRKGAFDYLLKPVEREKLYAVLKKLEDQYRQRQAQLDEQEQRLRRTLRHLMLEQDADSPEWREQAERCREDFFPGPYVGFCAGECGAPLPVGVLRLHAVGALTLYAAPEEGADTLSALLPVPVGRSGVHPGPDSLRLCYREARAAWQHSFFTGEPWAGPVPEAARRGSLWGWQGCPAPRRRYSCWTVRPAAPPRARSTRRPWPLCARSLSRRWGGTTSPSSARGRDPSGLRPCGTSPAGRSTWRSWARGDDLVQTTLISVCSRYLRSSSRSVMIPASLKGSTDAAVMVPNLLESASTQVSRAWAAAVDFTMASSGSGVVKPGPTAIPLAPKKVFVKLYFFRLSTVSQPMMAKVPGLMTPPST